MLRMGIVDDILPDSAQKHGGFLTNNPEMIPQMIQFIILNILAIDVDSSLGGRVYSHEKLNQS